MFLRCNTSLTARISELSTMLAADDFGAVNVLLRYEGHEVETDLVSADVFVGGPGKKDDFASACHHHIGKHGLDVLEITNRTIEQGLIIA